MPNIENRRQHEQALLLALAPVLIRQRERVVLARSDREPFADFQRELQQAMMPTLTSVYMQSATQLVTSADDELPEDSQRPLGFAFFQDARTWAAGLLALLLPELIQITVERIANARRATAAELADLGAEFTALDRDTRNEVEARTLRQNMGSAFGTERATTIAITEVTRANTAGETGALQRVAQQTPVVAVATWITADDELVCPICGPNHLQHERVWREQFPKGPSSTHPRCRCDIRYKFFPADAPEAQDAVFALNNRRAGLGL